MAEPDLCGETALTASAEAYEVMTVCRSVPGRSDGLTARPEGDTVLVAAGLPSKAGMVGIRGVPAMEGGMEEPGGGKIDESGTFSDPPCAFSDPGVRLKLGCGGPGLRLLEAFRAKCAWLPGPPATFKEPPGGCTDAPEESDVFRTH